MYMGAFAWGKYGDEFSSEKGFVVLDPIISSLSVAS